MTSESKGPSSKKVYGFESENGEAFVTDPGARRSADGVWSKGGTPSALEMAEDFAFVDDAKAIALSQEASAALRSI